MAEMAQKEGIRNSTNIAQWLGVAGKCNANHRNWGVRACRFVVLRMAVVILSLRTTLMTVGGSVGPGTGTGLGQEGEPKPMAWPDQFHAVLVMNNTKTTELQVIDLWYDWPNGRNLNLIQHQLGKRVYDVEWNNGTSFYYTLGAPGDGAVKECRTLSFEVGILRPNWLDGATYLGQRHLDGFLCNVWRKADFIWYYEDVLTRRPVHWLFYSGRGAHVMTFEVGAMLEDSQWEAPIYCFDKYEQEQEQRQRQYVTDDTYLELGLPLFRPDPLAFV